MKRFDKCPGFVGDKLASFARVAMENSLGFPEIHARKGKIMSLSRLRVVAVFG